MSDYNFGTPLLFVAVAVGAAAFAAGFTVGWLVFA